MKQHVKKLYYRIKDWFEKYERVMMPATLIFGVIVDSVTFASIQLSTAFLILGLHVLFAGAAIAYLNLYDAGLINKENRVLGYARMLVPLAIQFSFGALLSASFLFYTKSGSFFKSWPLIIILVFLMVANELFRKYYLRAHIHLTLYFFLLFSTLAIVLPFALQKLEIWIFLVSGFTAMILILGYIWLLSRFIKGFEIARFAGPIAAVFIVMNALYFSNIIPPIPLSVKESVVGHSIESSGGKYNILMEEQSFWDRVLPGQTFHKTAGGEVAVYTAVFAPGDLKIKIFHEWRHKENGKWVSKSRLSFVVAGGRTEGFRGYSIKTSVPEGEWRVDVETERGQVLGRVRFDVIETSSAPPLIQVTK